MKKSVPDRHMKYPTKNQYQDELTKIYHSKQTNLYHSYMNKFLKYRRVKEIELPQNPYTKIRMIENYRKLDSQFLKRKKRPVSVSDNLSRRSRLMQIAANNFRKTIHENNLIEMEQYRRLYGPEWLIYRKSFSGPEISSSFVEENEILKKKRFEPENIVSFEQTVCDETIIRNDKLSNELQNIDNKLSKGHNYMGTIKSSLFMDLIKRTYKNQINAIHRVIEDENQKYQARQNEYDESLRAHLEYSKEVCKKTAEAIQIDDEFAIERQRMKDLMKPKMTQIFELNQKYIRLEQIFNQYRAYKEFLIEVANSFLPEQLTGHFTEEEISERSCLDNLIKKKISYSNYKDEIDEHEVDKETDQIDRLLKNVFPDPSILINILTDLEATNLSFIELAEDYKERCEKITEEIAKFQVDIESKNLINKKNIELELENRDITRRELEESDRLLDNMDYFLDINKLCEDFVVSFDLPNLSLTTALAYMKDKIQNLHMTIFGSLSSKVNTTEMLKNFEILAVELIDCLAFLTPEEIKVAMNKTQEDRYRITRQVTKEIEARAQEARRIKTMKKASQPPRYQLTRRIMYRSKPIEKKTF